MTIKFKSITKRALAILFAFVMMFGVAYAADTSESYSSGLSDKELYVIELLDDLGIYEGVDSIVGKEAFVRRDVFAFLATRIMGLEDASYQGEPYFSDVDSKSFSYHSVNLLAQMNIIKGNGSGQFDPMRDITVDEATVMILRMMGYGQLLDVQEPGQWKHLVQKHKLHNGIEYAKDARLQVKHLSLLIYNALISDFPQIVSMDGNGEFGYEILKGENLLAVVFDVYEVKGLIASNGHTSTEITSSGDSGWVEIDGVRYQVGTTNAEQYIGQYVQAYYHRGEVNTLLCLDADSYTSIIEFDYDEVTYDNFVYTKDDNGRQSKYKVSRGLNLIYNGKAIYYDRTKMIPTYGTISLVDNNKDKVYDTVIINSVRNLIVANYGSNSNRVQSKYDNQAIDFNRYDEDMYSIHTVEGKPFKLTSLKEWDVLSVQESADGKYLDITVSTDSVNGTVEMISVEDGNTILTIEGVQYEVAPTFLLNSNYEVALNYSGTFYLDMYGRIAAANGKINHTKWGYLLQSQQRRGFEQYYSLKLLTQDASEIKILDTAEKFYVNNVPYTGSNIDSLVLANYQVVRYSLNSAGKINRLYTVGNDFVELKAKYADGYASNAFGNSVAMDSNTVIFQVPNTTRANDDPADETFYALKSLSSFNSGDWYWVNSYGYEADDVTAALVVVERFYSSAANPSGTYMVISDIRSGLNKDGEIVDKITGIDSAKNKVEILTRAVGTASGFGIEKGDFVAMVLYPDGTLQKAVKVYDCSSNSLNSAYSGIDYDQANFARFGYGYNSTSKFLQLSASADAFSNHKVYSTSSATVLIVDSVTNEVSVGSIGDIKTYTQSGVAAKVVVYGRQSVPRLIVSYQ